MSVEDFVRLLSGRLCWLDQFPTTNSSALQRQCPHCRQKWSYTRLAKKWDVARSFASGKTRAQAAAELKMNPHTVGKYFSQFEEEVAGIVIRSLKKSQAFDFADEVELLETLARCQKLKTAGARNREIATLGLRHLPAEHRLDLIFRTVFQEEVRAMIEQRFLPDEEGPENPAS